MPTIVRGAMVATSHPLATRAGVQALERGGNAADAALAAAAMLTVAEPGHNGPGGDAFALLWMNGGLYGLNGSGRSPAELPRDARVQQFGPRSVTVPGVVGAWTDLAARFGRLGLDEALAPAIDAAEHGLTATARVARQWALVQAQRGTPWPAPKAGEIYRLPELARTLRRIAEHGAAGLYEGPVAEAIAAASWLSVDDLAAYRSEWVEPLRLAYHGVEVCELPPNGQGAAALIALALDEELAEPRLHRRIEAMKLALADAYRYVADEPLPGFLLDPAHLAERRSLIQPDRALDPEPSIPPRGGTTYLCCVDEDRNAVSLIQSTYEHFGSGVVAGDTGVVLQNRGAGFVDDPSHPNALAPAKRPFHTIIPGMLLEGGDLLGPFGVMGGAMQAQGHFQLVGRMVDEGLDPQAALDAARFRVEAGRRVLLEPGLWPEADALRALGHEPVLAESPNEFGVGQAIVVSGEALVGGSDGRGDGHAAGY
ncbi:MAG: gamma-glutamyltranspeptidase / glutathione hydrolase [Gaiellaceae bacterium]|nr:gamma-glutamyltranspeptidase / glutathione hydrolase [Gaiellaceae bacterium]